MKITEIFIQSFGKLHNFRIAPNDGVSIIYGDNESGKTTIMAFIRAMFYGAGKGEARRKYEPWDGSRMSGAVAFECGGIKYQLARQFGQTRALDKISLRNAMTGEEVQLPDKTEPGEFLLKINEMTFLNSVFIGQINPAIAGDNHEIISKLLNLASTGDETASRSEIEARLSEAAASIRSKRSGAILPALEAERAALLEQRSSALAQTAAADKLRSEIVELEQQRDEAVTLLEQLQAIEEFSAQRKQLAEYDSILAQHDAIERDQKKYDIIHEALYTSSSPISEQFVDDTRELLDECKQQQTVIRCKREQLDECDQEMDGIDRSHTSSARIVKKHGETIRNALERYKDLKNQRDVALRQFEQMQATKQASMLSDRNVLLIAALATLFLFLLGLLMEGGEKWIFIIFAILIAAGTGVFFFAKSRGILPGQDNEESILIKNIDDDISELNGEIGFILDELGIDDIEQLADEVSLITRTYTQIDDCRKRRSRISDELTELEAQYAQSAAKLREALDPYASVESDEQAIAVLSKIDKKQREHSTLAATLEVARTALNTALAGRSIEEIYINAEELRAKVAERGEVAEIDDATIERRQAEITAQLGEINTSLVRKETELSVSAANPQESSEIVEKVKMLDSRIEHYEFELAALNEAIDALGEAFTTMQEDFGPIINFKAGRILDELTGGKYSSVLISDALVPSVSDPESSSIHTCTSVSLGTSDQIYLALRLAIVGILGDEPLPVFLDEAFAQYDDKRMQDALFYLARESGSGIGQTILFTCHKRVISAAAEVGIRTPVINMNKL